MLAVCMCYTVNMINPNDPFLTVAQRRALKYSEDELLKMLQSDDIDDIYESLTAIGIRKLKTVLERLKYMALYEDDIALQEEAIRTIRRIGGKKAIDILRFLKTTDHKALIEGILKYGADYSY